MLFGMFLEKLIIICVNKLWQQEDSTMYGGTISDLGQPKNKFGASEMEKNFEQIS